MQITFTVDTIEEAASHIYEAGKIYQVWAFHGEMGAGKTTLIHALCKILQVTSAVASPTYAIVNEYVTGQSESIFHMDWYRLKDEEDAIQAGVEEILYSNRRCFVEWPDKAGGLLPHDTLHLFLTVVDAGRRSLSIPMLA